MNSQIVTHNNQQYKVTPLGNGSLWRLTLVDSPREGFTANRDWLVNKFFWPQVESQLMQANRVRAAQSKAAIAEFTNNHQMWQQAAEQLQKSMGIAQ